MPSRLSNGTSPIWSISIIGLPFEFPTKLSHLKAFERKAARDEEGGGVIVLNSSKISNRGNSRANNSLAATSAVALLCDKHFALEIVFNLRPSPLAS